MPRVLLHHGMFGGDKHIAGITFSGFKGIDRAIAAAGYPVWTSAVHPCAGIAVRAGQLKQFILSRWSEREQRMVLIAHSLGGLDARYMLARLGMAPYVSALLTISTPHRGSPWADWCVRNVGNRLHVLPMAQRLGFDLRGALDCTTDACLRFNETVPDVPGVAYYSISACRPWFKMPLFGLPSYKVVQREQGDNDSLVSVWSSRWANHLATWPADHWHQVNRRFMPEGPGGTGDISPYYVAALRQILSATSQAA